LTFWGSIKLRIKNKSFKNFNKPQYLDYIYNNWINNKSYSFIYNGLAGLDIKMGITPRARKLTVDYISEICEKALSFESTLILSSIIEFLSFYDDEYDISRLKTNLNVFQKKLKYGLSSNNAILIYEMGFADKFISLELANLIEEENAGFSFINEILKSNRINVQEILVRYPSYFMNIYNGLFPD